MVNNGNNALFYGYGIYLDLRRSSIFCCASLRYTGTYIYALREKGMGFARELGKKGQKREKEMGFARRRGECEIKFKYSLHAQRLCVKWIRFRAKTRRKRSLIYISTACPASQRKIPLLLITLAPLRETHFHPDYLPTCFSFALRIMAWSLLTAESTDCSNSGLLSFIK